MGRGRLGVSASNRRLDYVVLCSSIVTPTTRWMKTNRILKSNTLGAYWATTGVGHSWRLKLRMRTSKARHEQRGAYVRCESYRHSLYAFHLSSCPSGGKHGVSMQRSDKPSLVTSPRGLCVSSRLDHFFRYLGAEREECSDWMVRLRCLWGVVDHFICYVLAFAFSFPLRSVCFVYSIDAIEGVWNVNQLWRMRWGECECTDSVLGMMSVSQSVCLCFRRAWL